MRKGCGFCVSEKIGPRKRGPIFKSYFLAAFLRFTLRVPRFFATFFTADFFAFLLAGLRDLDFVDLPTFFFAELLAFAMMYFLPIVNN